MTRSESQCREWIKETYPGCLVLKIPDFKMTSSGVASGWPDFLVVHGGVTFFVECKTWKAKSFTKAQLYLFPLIVEKGGVVLVWVKERRGFSVGNYFP